MIQFHMLVQKYESFEKIYDGVLMSTIFYFF